MKNVIILQLKILMLELGTNFPQSQPLVKDCHFGVSPVKYSDSDVYRSKNLSSLRRCLKEFANEVWSKRVLGFHTHSILTTKFCQSNLVRYSVVAITKLSQGSFFNKRKILTSVETRGPMVL